MVLAFSKDAKHRPSEDGMTSKNQLKFKQRQTKKSLEQLTESLNKIRLIQNEKKVLIKNKKTEQSQF